MNDHSDAEWLAALRSAKADAALEALRAYLTRGLRSALIQKHGVTEADIEDFVQESLLRILAALDSFRGDSRFTTWAQKIAVHTALSELRRRRWQDVALDDLLPPDDQEAAVLETLAAPSPSPEQQVIQRQFVALMQQVIIRNLTERQRLAISAVMDHDMPLAEVARRMGTNRNALYKLLHDARLRLKHALAAQGFTAQELLAMFEED